MTVERVQFAEEFMARVQRRGGEVEILVTVNEGTWSRLRGKATTEQEATAAALKFGETLAILAQASGFAPAEIMVGLTTENMERGDPQGASGMFGLVGSPQDARYVAFRAEVAEFILARSEGSGTCN
jgi:hypothetical protein